MFRVLALQVLKGEPEIGEHVFEGNRVVMLQPLCRFGDGPAFFGSLRFVVNAGVCDGAGDRIEHGFEQGVDGGELG